MTWKKGKRNRSLGEKEKEHNVTPSCDLAAMLPDDLGGNMARLNAQQSTLPKPSTGIDMAHDMNVNSKKEGNHRWRCCLDAGGVRFECKGDQTSWKECTTTISSTPHIVNILPCPPSSIMILCAPNDHHLSASLPFWWAICENRSEERRVGKECA